MFLKENRLGIIWSLIITLICLVPGGNSSGISFFASLGIDKIIHAGIHFVLIYFVSTGLLKQSAIDLSVNSAFVIAFFYSVLLGVGMEILQMFFVPGRSGDIYDVIANVTGAIVGVILFLKPKKVKN